MKETKRVLLVRLGAIGDMVIVTPLIRYLHEQGNEVAVLGSEVQAEAILRHNPRVHKFIPHKTDCVPNNKLDEYFKAVADANECDKVIDMCESMEIALAIHPKDPWHNYPKWERQQRCDTNVYDFAFKFAGLPEIKGQRGEMFFTKEEESFAEKFYKEKTKDKAFVIVWCLSGSGRNKTYPFAEFVMGDLLQKYSRLHIVTVGDYPCKMLENIEHSRMIHQAGELSLRDTACITKHADLVIAPDTGILHISGCYDTPKIGIMSHTTKKQITSNFINDYSIEAQCDCAPCFRLIYNSIAQCPLDPVSLGTECMTKGLPPERMYKHVCSVVDKYYGRESKRVFA